ncbi:MAG TPA: hypothetical protein PK076_01300 [Saprospiraceae bacterium]|nr:hypothetical protein [Saprospiraceae bacterium]HQW54727.1 hypothetical protein [Saprospiraceae bacterium]
MKISQFKEDLIEMINRSGEEPNETVIFDAINQLFYNYKFAASLSEAERLNSELFQSKANTEPVELITEEEDDFNLVVPPKTELMAESEFHIKVTKTWVKPDTPVENCIYIVEIAQV